MIHDIYQEMISFENIYRTWRTVHKTCKNRSELMHFSQHLYANLYEIECEMRERRYTPDKFRTFMIFEPKARLVMSQSVRDKIVNHFVANYYLLPLLEKKLIDANVATRKGRGSKHAMTLLIRYFAQIGARESGKTIYALKIDVSKYFYSISHKMLLSKLRRFIQDGDIASIIRKIIDETNQPYINDDIDRYNLRYGTDIPHYEHGRGLSIGAMTSQFLAIFYLNDIDHYLKEKLHCKYYIRYMDDFLILDTDKNKLKIIADIVEGLLAEHELVLNPKSAIYNTKNGFVFLGYHYRVVDGILRVKCSSKSILRARRRLKGLAQYDSEKHKRSQASYQGYLMAAKDERRKI